MRRRLLPLLLLGLLGLVGVSGAVSGGSGAQPPAWGPAIEVPGTAALNRGDAVVNSVSCATADDCAAGGYYQDAHGHTQAFVVDETNGSWGTAIKVPGTATLNSGGYAEVNSVSCAAAGNCIAGGSYADGSDTSSAQAFVVDETNGSWGDAIEVPGTATLNGDDNAEVDSVSCAAAGNCVAGGSYTDDQGYGQAFVVDETDGSWGNAIEGPGTATLNSGGDAKLWSVSCATVGNCAAGGYYQDGHGHAQAFVIDETNGSWDNAIEVPGTATLNLGGYGDVLSVSCATAGNCAAGGDYLDRNLQGQAFVVSETNGSWGNAIKVPGTATLNRGDAAVTAVSCATAGNCTAGGVYSVDSYVGQAQAFIVDETNGSWGNAIKVPGTATLNSGNGAGVNSISCATAGNCAAGGYSTGQAFVVDETNGSWGMAIEVPGTAALNRGDDAGVNSISCATAGNCAAGGYYLVGRLSHGHSQAFVVSSAPPVSLNAGGTSCDGAYAGTGDHVVVPAGRTCTLVPGTHVTHNVTVSNGGALYAAGVKIGGVLKIAGSATVCQSRVLSDVKAVSAGGALNLGGGPGCVRGNTFLHDVVVRHDSHDVWIEDNKVAGNLVVLNSHGATDSIVGNNVDNLLVGHSGPVVVKNNHAKSNLRCIANKPQRGNGNRARGKNTCPK